MSTDTVKGPAREALLAVASEAIGETTTLWYLGQGDQLDRDQLQKLFGGMLESFDESVFESADEARRHYARQELAGLPAIVRDAAEDDLSLEQELIEMIEGRDDSDVQADLIRATPRQLFRYKLSPDWWGHGQAHRRSDEDHEDFAFDIASALGLDGATFRELRDDLIELSTEGGDAQELYVIWYGEVRELAELVIGVQAEQAGHDTPRTISWYEPSVVLLDRMGGSGHDVTLKAGAQVKVPFDPDLLCLDDEGFGYGWDATASVVKSYYANDPTITPAWEAP